MSLSIIIQTVKGHLEDFIGLTQTIPGTVVPLVHFNGMPDITKHEKKHNSHNTNTAALNSPHCYDSKPLNKDYIFHIMNKILKYLPNM